ncbi:hypothetical protein GHI93_07905 [Lactococcus hircilactis]|uniref:Uncharacterized protein n=1 Tax=Lactococcus hircilactis TaxID=1494462 RepID=A0A7X2D1W6_9LACT|nr:hypothetical protein [Lactococcus hircilactis]MQW39847.1 hypothetical protein [Lactococcus hircilactis]
MKTLKKSLDYSNIMAPKLFALFIIYQIPTGMLYAWTILGDKKVSILIALLILIVTAFVLIFFLSKAKEINLVNWRLHSLWEHKWAVILGILIAIVWFQFILNAVFDFFKVGSSVSANQQLINSMASKAPEYLMVILTAIFAPICEELIF